MVDARTRHGFAEAAVCDEVLFELVDLLVEQVGRIVFATKNTKRIAISLRFIAAQEARPLSC